MQDERSKKLKAIKDELIKNSALPLYKERVQNKVYPVIGEGNHYAEIMFVGEAPGQHEAKTGRPFCGAAGKVLDEMLHHVDIEREDVYITSILKDRPPKNRDPKPDEIAAYAPYLDKQIEIIQPFVIVTLGRFSMEYLMTKYQLADQLQPISKIHGKAFKLSQEPEERFLMTMYHPAAALYNGSLREALMGDMQKLMAVIEQGVDPS